VEERDKTRTLAARCDDRRQSADSSSAKKEKPEGAVRQGGRPYEHRLVS
jgi:hypothetical protein